MTDVTSVRRRQRREAGFSVLWTVVSVALLGVALLCLATLDPEIVLPAGALASCVGVAAAGLTIAARRDFYEFRVVAGRWALVGAAGCVAAGFWLDREALGPRLAGGVLGLCGTTCLVSAWRESHREERLPNVLLQDLSRSEICELSGVQFGVVQSDTVVAAGEELGLHVLVQNGFDCARGFALHIRPRADVGRAEHLVFEKELYVDLPGGAAASLWIPIAIHPKARGSYLVRVEPRVTGSGGTRIRRWRAKRYRPPVGPAEQILALLLGGLAWGGGLGVEFRVRKSDADPDAFPGAAPGNVELVYVPEAAVVRGLALTP